MAGTESMSDVPRVDDQAPPENGGTSALVLSGGGARAAYQVGVLAGIAERAGDISFPIVTGVSAGSISAAHLASYEGSLKRGVALLEHMWLRMRVDHVFCSGVASILWGTVKSLWMMAVGGRAPSLGVRGILDTRPLRRSLSRVVSTDGIDANLGSGRLRAVALSTTSFATGRTVTFVHGADGVPTWRRAGRVAIRTRISVDHVMASCALPLIFPAIPVGDAYFGDGSIRQAAPLAPAIHLGAGRILAIAVRNKRNLEEEAQSQIVGYPPPAQIVGMLFNAVFVDALDHDCERLERTNRTIAALPEGSRHPDGLRAIEHVVLRPSRNLGALSADLVHHLPRALRLVVLGMGASKLRSPDLLSYLLFEKPYIERLIELGRQDTLSQWDKIAPLLEPERAGSKR